MFKKIRGKTTNAIVFTDNIEDSALDILKEMCDKEWLQHSKIRIMPDVHAGKGCNIGTTLTLGDKVDPRYVGVDLGCGVSAYPIRTKDVDYRSLDNFIRNNIPYGMNVNKARNSLYPCHSLLSKLKCGYNVDIERAELALGTLGGGNHYLELGQGGFCGTWLMIHTGSRSLGKQIADHYKNIAITDNAKKKAAKKDSLISLLLKSDRHLEISDELKKLEENTDVFVLYGEHFEDYLHDLNIAMKFAKLNRQCISKKIIEFLGEDFNYSYNYHIDTVHNYIDKDNILRKGAISAKTFEKLLIPISMKEGTILGVGKGNEAWNCSAPHGAGRILSRGQARKGLSLELFKNDMAGIWTSCISETTLEEAPQAYKSLDYILERIEPTVSVVDILKPIYNFKGD